MLHSTLGRYCYAGYHLDQTGQAFDFQGICDPGAPPPEQSKRICEIPYYQHPNGSVYYDIKGYCDPTLTVIPMAMRPPSQQTQSNTWIWAVVEYGALALGAWYLWKHRKIIF